MHNKEIEKPDLKDLCKLEECLVKALEEELPIAVKMSNGGQNVALYGQVVDMVKDLAEAKKCCMEAYYYENVVKAMEESEHNMARYDGEDEEPMGYDNWRYSSGRFAPKGRGTYRGYMPPYMLEDRLLPPDMRYMDENMSMGYSGGRGGSGNSQSSNGGGGNRGGNRGSQSGNSGNYDYGGGNGQTGSGRYGYSYDEYQNAKNSGDKVGMENKAMEHMTGMLGTIRDVWKDSDPALKKRLKSELTAFVNNEMTV